MKEYVSNDSCIEIITQAIDVMKAEMGDSFSVDRINLAELERRTGVTRARPRRYKTNGFHLQHGCAGLKVEGTVLSGYTSVLDNLLRQGITNSSVCLDRLREVGYMDISVGTKLLTLSTCSYHVADKNGRFIVIATKIQ